MAAWSSSELWFLCGVQIFTESLTHTATEWTDTQHPRVALFTCYDTVNAMYAHTRFAIPAQQPLISFLRACDFVA